MTIKLRDDLANAMANAFILTKLSLTEFQYKKMNKALAQQYAQQLGIDADAFTLGVNHLVGADAPLKELSKRLHRMRTFWYRNTLAFGADEGRGQPRLLFAGRVREFFYEFGRLAQEVDAAREDVRRQWPNMVATAQQKLGPIADTIHYPPADWVVGRYTYRLEKWPLPSVDTVQRIPLLQEEVIEAAGVTFAEKLRSSIEVQFKESAEGTIRCLKEKLMDITQSLVHALREVKGDERSARISSSLPARCDIVASDLESVAATIADDGDADKLKDLAKEFRELAAVDVNKLRNSETMKAQARERAAKAAQIVDTLF